MAWKREEEEGVGRGGGMEEGERAEVRRARVRH